MEEYAEPLSSRVDTSKSSERRSSLTSEIEQQKYIKHELLSRPRSNMRTLLRTTIKCPM